MTPFIPPDELVDFTWRAVQMADIPAIQALTAMAKETDKGEAAATKEHLTQLLGMLGERAATDTLTAVAHDGTIAALALLFFPPDDEEHTAMISGLVHPNYRGQGLGNAILNWMEARAGEELSSYDDHLPRKIRTTIADHQQARIDLLQAHGFQAARYSYKMQRDLHSPLPEKPLAGGLQLTGWSETLDGAVREAFNEAFHGHWGLPHMTPELWRQIFIDVPQFRGDLSYLALDGQKIAGFCLNWVNAGKNEQTGIGEGWIEAVGVVPAWRGRSVASTLMIKSMNAFIAEGLERAALDVDTQNPTGALRVYEKLGFTAVKRSVIFQKILNNPV